MDSKLREVVGDFVAPKGKIAIVASRFNEFMVKDLIFGAQDTLLRHGLKEEQIEIFRVPGAYELPLICQKVAQTHRFDGIIALGVVIKGATSHFHHVSSSCINGLQQVQLKTEVPVILGVLTTENMEQGIERSGSKAGNKGSDAAMALLEVINLMGKIND